MRKMMGEGGWPGTEEMEGPDMAKRYGHCRDVLDLWHQHSEGSQSASYRGRWLLEHTTMLDTSMIVPFVM